MSKIYGYFLYNINSDLHEKHWFVWPYLVYGTLSGAKNSKIISKFTEDVSNMAWLIVPIKHAFDHKSKIKYMLINGQWTTDIDEKIAAAFYRWRGDD